MSQTEMILVAVIVVLIIGIVWHYFDMKKQSDDKDAIEKSEILKNGVNLTESMTKHKPPTPKTPEDESTERNTVYYNIAGIGGEGVTEDYCRDDGKLHYGVDEFGGPGIDYKTWIASQTVDPSTIRHHEEFVKDRKKNTQQNILGRTYSPDSHESYDPIPWAGLRRPEQVKVGNPTQTPDIDYSLYNKKPTFTWSSS